jgi:hypothetical protein
MAYLVQQAVRSAHRPAELVRACIAEPCGVVLFIVVRWWRSWWRYIDGWSVLVDFGECLPALDAGRSGLRFYEVRHRRTGLRAAVGGGGGSVHGDTCGWLWPPLSSYVERCVRGLPEAWEAVIGAQILAEQHKTLLNGLR